MQLNEEQQKAAEFRYGIAHVLATPGSGKTLTMTQRISLLVNQGAAPESILALAYTRNAADAMRQRLRPILGKKALRVHLATIHSFCYRVLINENRQFELLQGKEQLRFLKKSMQKVKIKHLPSGMILREISLAKSNLISIEEFRTLYQGDQTMQKIADAAETYELEKRKNLYLDFDDLLLEVLELMKTDDQVRKKYQEMYQHVMVDEFQDTNPAQMALLKCLIQKAKKEKTSFWICGDDWQSIYSFTGASVGNILNFRDQFPDSDQYILNMNYRSTPQILQACQNLIRHNTKKVEKRLTTLNPDGNQVTVIEATNEEDEALKLVTEVLDLTERSGFAYKDIAVLYRANYQARVIEEAFTKHKIPYHIENGTSFYDRYEVRVLLEYLRLIDNPLSSEGDEALKQIINVPNRYIGRIFTRELEEFAEKNNLHLWSALEKIPIQISYLKRFVKEFKEIIRPMLKAKLDPADAIHALREALDYDSFIVDSDLPSPDDSKIANINQLQIVAAKYNDISSLLNYTDSFKAEMSNDKQGVRLMTIHKAKGLEFPTVWVLGMLEGVLPNPQNDTEEERRIAFVAASRAMHRLYVSYSQKYLNKNVQKSRFLTEMFDQGGQSC